jgi:hypothetical protein
MVFVFLQICYPIFFKVITTIAVTVAVFILAAETPDARGESDGTAIPLTKRTLSLKSSPMIRGHDLNALHQFDCYPVSSLTLAYHPDVYLSQAHVLAPPHLLPNVLQGDHNHCRHSGCFRFGRANN